MEWVKILISLLSLIKDSRKLEIIQRDIFFLDEQIKYLNETNENELLEIYKTKRIEISNSYWGHPYKKEEMLIINELQNKYKNLRPIDFKNAYPLYKFDFNNNTVKVEIPLTDWIFCFSFLIITIAPAIISFYFFCKTCNNIYTITGLLLSYVAINIGFYLFKDISHANKIKKTLNPKQNRFLHIKIRIKT